jgi:hypothetical protein
MIIFQARKWTCDKRYWPVSRYYFDILLDAKIIRELLNPVFWSLISAQVFVPEMFTRALDDPNVADRFRH